MQRGSEDLARIVQDPSWKRVDRLMPEAAGTDPRAAIVFLLGVAAVMLTCAAAQ